MEKMRVPPAREGSWEDVVHRACGEDRLLLTEDLRGPDAAAPRGHRAIGVIYAPALEARGNYVPTVLPARYDALVYLDETRALEPPHPFERPVPSPPETTRRGSDRG